MDEWLEKYRREYESLPPLASIPESEREDEFHRREEIRKALYALPDAPRPSELSDLEKIVQCAKDDLIASWINEAWCPEDQTLLHTWWRVHDFAGEYRPKFNDETLERKSANLELLIKTPCNTRGFQSQELVENPCKPNDSKKAKRPNANLRMLEYLQKNQKAKGFTVRQWMCALNIKSPSTIHATKTWEALQKTRCQGKYERLERQANKMNESPNSKKISENKIP